MEHGPSPNRVLPTLVPLFSAAATPTAPDRPAGIDDPDQPLNRFRPGGGQLSNGSNKVCALAIRSSSLARQHQETRFSTDRGIDNGVEEPRVIDDADAEDESLQQRRIKVAGLGPTGCGSEWRRRR
jgi:hypothetical protein